MAAKQLKSKQTTAQKTAERSARKKSRLVGKQQSPPEFQANKSGYVPVGTEAEQQHLRKLQADMQKVDIDYVNYVKKQNPYNENKAEMRRKFSGMNGVFFNQMLLTCVSPLQDGVSMESVTQCLAMYMGMRAFNKDFKNRVDNMATQAKYNKLMKTVEKKGADSKAGQKAQQQAAALKRKMTMYNNGGREPLTAHGAALTKIGMAEKAYVDMRQPGADVEKIKRQYAEAVSTLDSQCMDDGIRVADVDKQMRTIVGQWSDSNPTHPDIYKELSYEGVGRAPYHKNPNNPNQLIWTGEYMDFDGKMFNGAFTPREPLTVESAAQIKLDMTVQAYENMRKDGADIDAFFTQYTESMETVSRLCKADGVDERAVNQQMRVKIGQEIQKDPSFANVFSELSYDGVEKAPPHRSPDNPNQAIWTGEYLDADGQLFEGQFTPRAPLTQDKAALLKMEMTLDAYTDMREPGADVDGVMQKYRGRMAGLSKQCAVDKINEYDVNQQVRIMVGEYCDRVPGAATVFKEMTDDGITKAPAHIDATNPDVAVWTGEYRGADGKPFNKAFTPRPPRSYDDHMADLKKNMNQQFKQVKTADELYGVLRSYVTAAGAVFGDASVSDADKANPVYQSVNADMRLLHDDCVFDKTSIAQLKERTVDLPDGIDQHRVSAKIAAYEASNAEFDQKFGRQFSKLLGAAQSRVSPNVMKEFKAVYGDPNNVVDVIRTASQQQADAVDSPDKTTWRVYDSHVNALENNAKREFAQVKSSDELCSVFTGYVAGYESVCNGASVSRDVMDNPTYQAVSNRMRFMLGDCGSNPDVMRDFESQFDSVLDAAQRKVSPDVMQAFIHEYDDPDVFVKKLRVAYENQLQNDIEYDIKHPMRGHEHDMPDTDLSAKGRGAEAERRLGVEGLVGPENPNKDYQV